MKFTIYQESRIGRRRSNQDRIAYCYSREALLMMVADGMGGHLHGEIAAQIAVQYVTERFREKAKPTLEDPGFFLTQALVYAHHAILDYALDKDLEDTPRTTAVACILQQGQAWWAHAGDSRLYHVRRGRILSRTKDHSQVRLLLDQGSITPEEAAVHPHRNRIFSCLGSVGAPQIDVHPPVRLRDEDRILLCTDGAWGPLPDKRLVELLSADTVVKAVPLLLNESEKRGGETCDNLSVVAMTWHDEHGHAAAPTTGSSISTDGMAQGDVATRMQGFARKDPHAPIDLLSDQEIEKAINEINHAIQKFTRK
jgi:PPM family protein phosphatase